MARQLLSIFLYLTTLISLVFAQANVTVFDSDPSIKFNPECNPRDTYCKGGWYAWNFAPNDARMITFGPGDVNGFLPSASFSFQGTAVFFYSIASPRTGVVAITLDGGTPQIVNLTSKYGLTADSPIEYPVLSWSQNGLDGSLNHTFFLEWNDPDVLEHKWVGFDSIVYTTPATMPSTWTDATRAGGTATGTMPVESASPNSHKAVGGLVAGLVVAAVVIIALLVGGFFWWRRYRRRAGTAPIADLDADDMAPAPLTGPNNRATVTNVVPYTLLSNVRDGEGSGPGSPGIIGSASGSRRGSEDIEHASSGISAFSNEKRRQSLLSSSDRSSEPYNPDTMQAILNQQRTIMQLLQQQQGASSSSTSHYPKSDSDQGWNPDVKQVYQQSAVVANPTPVPGDLPAGAAAPSRTTEDPGTMAPPAYFR